MHISPITKYPQSERCVLDIIPKFFGLKVRVIKSFKTQACNHICPLGIEGVFLLKKKKIDSWERGRFET